MHPGGLAGYPGKGGSNTREWVSPRSVKNYTTERNNEHVTGISGRVTDDTNQNDRWRDQPLRCNAKQGSKSCIDEASVFSDADAQHGDQNNTDRVKV